MPMGRGGGGHGGQRKKFLHFQPPMILTPLPLPTGILYSPEFHLHQ